MVLNNVKLIGADEPVNIQIVGCHIAKAGKKTLAENSGHLQLTFDNALAFPGLINSHDHLDFNLFPQFGDKTYNNYTEWGKHIHEQYPDEIAEILKIPIILREEWGMLKNLFCGVTTVVNHGEKVQTKSNLIGIHEQCQCIHSVGFEKNWKFKINRFRKKRAPVVIHAGEGIDYSSQREISQLIKWNILQKKLIGVHAVAMSATQAQKFKAVVWCPQSNFFLLDKTAPVNELKNHTNILFGTDSTLTGSWDIWEHIRDARKTGLLSDDELYNSLSSNAAMAWQTCNAKFEPGKKADVVVARIKNNKDTLNSFFSTTPEDILLVLRNGEIQLFDAEVKKQLTDTDLSGFSKVYINGACKYINYNVPGLMKEIRHYYPKVSFPVMVG